MSDIVQVMAEPDPVPDSVIEGRAENSGQLPRPRYRLSYSSDTHPGVPIWLISMTDLMGIILTFFILLFSMSVRNDPDAAAEREAVPVEQGAGGAGTTLGGSGTAGDQDTISINKIDYNQSLNLGYLKSVLESAARNNATLQKVRIIEDADNKRMILTLPHDLLFQKGRADLNDAGAGAVRLLTGVLKHIPNGIEIIGHADPTQAANKSGTDNWEISLGRAMAVARLMEDEGYTRTLPVMGASSGLYDQLPSSLPVEQREELARRVDLIINLHDNTFQQRFGIGPQ